MDAQRRIELDPLDADLVPPPPDSAHAVAVVGGRRWVVDQPATRRRALVFLPQGATGPRDVVVIGRQRRDRMTTFEDLSVDARVAVGRVVFAAGPQRCQNVGLVASTQGSRHRAVRRCVTQIGRGGEPDFGVTPDGRLVCGYCCSRGR